MKKFEMSYNTRTHRPIKTAYFGNKVNVKNGRHHNNDAQSRQRNQENEEANKVQ